MTTVDKRFSRGYTLDSLNDLKASLILSLHQTYFKVDKFDEQLSYDGPMGYLVELIFEGKLIPDLMDIFDQSPDSIFYNGCLVVEIHDHRAPVRTASGPSVDVIGAISDQRDIKQVHRILLRPDSASLMSDMNLVRTSYPMLSDDQLLQIEAEILNSSNMHDEPLCLNPSTSVSRAASILCYNSRRLSTFVRRRAKRQRLVDRQTDDKGHESKSRSSLDNIYTSLIPKEENVHKNTVNDFKQMFFIEDWRRTKLNEAAVTVSMSDKLKLHIPREITNDFKHIVRIMKFSKITETESIYTNLIIFINAAGVFEAILRWGKQPDTAVGGNALKFHLGDSSAVDLYTRNFLSLYNQCEKHQLVSDSKLTADQLTVLQQQIQLRKPSGNFASSRSGHAATKSAIDVNTNPSLSNPVVASYSPSTTSPPPSNGNGQSQQVQRQQSALQQRMQTIETKVQRHQNQPQASGQAPPIDHNSPGTVLVSSTHAAPNTNFVPPNAAKSSSSASIRQWANNPEALQQLLKQPYQQVPDEYKGLYLQLHQKLQEKQKQHQQAQAARGQTSAQVATPQQQQQKMQQLLQQQQFLQQQAVTSTSQPQQQQQPSRNLAYAQLQRMANVNPSLVASIQASQQSNNNNIGLTVQQMNQLLLQQQQQQFQGTPNDQSGGGKTKTPKNH